MCAAESSVAGKLVVLQDLTCDSSSSSLNTAGISFKYSVRMKFRHGKRVPISARRSPGGWLSSYHNDDGRFKYVGGWMKRKRVGDTTKQ